MTSETPPPPSDQPGPEPLKGLPTVTAPSGRHIVQLFLIPGLIVAGAVTILLGFSWLAGGSRSPEQLLKNIDSANPDIRWRAANDLAQVLKRDDALAADVGFALKIAERLARAAEELERAEKHFSDISDSDARGRAEAKKALVAQRNYVQYLEACLGNFIVPVGAPLLTDLGVKGRGSDEKIRYMVRRAAVWGLANLGDGQNRYAKLDDSQKSEIRKRLDAEAAGGGESAAWAGAALNWMDGKAIGVVAALTECAKDQRDIFLRELTAQALRFWEGATPDEKRLGEEALVVMTRDLGAGSSNRIEITEDE